MTAHVCPRCGHEDPCSYGTWYDRHPVAATVAGLFALTLMGMMFSVHPVASAAMVALAAVWFVARAALREWRRRSAVATRADYEHAQIRLREAQPNIRRRPSWMARTQPLRHR